MNTSQSLATRILLLEDSKEFALLISRWLRDAGYQVDHADDLPLARSMLSEQHYDVIVSDIELPSGDSFSFWQNIKEILPSCTLIAITSQQRADYALQALRLKADDLLFKPFKAEDIVDKVRDLLERRYSTRKSILAIGAHPDDVELGCAGSLRGHVARGDQVHILTLSGGEAGGLADERAHESRAAAQLLGAGLTLAHLVDTQISEGAQTIGLIEQCIDKLKPHIIYTHTEKDGHQDHRNTFRATLVAARQIPTLLCYQAPSTTVQFMPTRFVEIGAYLQTKQNVIAAYTSQASKRPYMQALLVEATARYWGRFAGYGICEAFEVIRERSD